MSKIVDYDTHALWKIPWNPVSGCSPVSPGCDNCSARWTVQNLGRFPAMRAKYKEGFKPVVHWHLLKRESSSLFSERAERRLSRDGTPPALKLMAIATMGDLYHSGISDQARDFLFMRLQGGRQVSWNITKWTTNMMDYWARRTPPKRFWQGVSCESPAYLSRVDQLLTIPFTKRILALEPVLERFPAAQLRPYLDVVDWVIVSAEFGHALVKGARTIRPCKPEWLEEIIDCARQKGLPVLLRSAGGLMKGKKAVMFLDGRKHKIFGQVWRQCPDPNDEPGNLKAAA